MAEPLQIDVAAATAALEAAGGADGGLDGAVNPDPWPRNADGTFASKQAEAVVETPETSAPEGDKPEDAAPDFTAIPDEALTPELLQMKRSLQADYTRKTQEAAPWRKLGDEFGISNPDEFRTAADLYAKMSDPANWPEVHRELAAYMQQYGLTPAEASAAASDRLADFAPDTPPDLDLADSFTADGDAYQVPPALLKQLQAQSQQIEQLTKLVTGDREEQARQAQWNAVAAQLTSVENQIKAENPHYSENDISNIYQMMGPNGDLREAQQRYEGVIGARVAEYIKSKAAAQETTPHIPSGAGVLSQASEGGKMTVAEGHAKAMALAAQMDRESA